MNILFVCSGNICRSPLAAALVRHKVACLSLSPLPCGELPEIAVQSAGTAASEGQPMSVAMEMILAEKGIDSHHLSQRLHWDLIDWADLILTMTQPQKLLLISQVPALAPKLSTLNEYVGRIHQPDIEDPYGTDLDSYRRCAAEIELACDRLLAQLHPRQTLLE